MRLAFGASAVAAVSALTIGMVRPDFAGTAATPSSGDPAASEAGQSGNAEVSVHRVTDYVLLKPGEKAPRGATVISAEELLGLNDSRATRASKPDRPNRPQAQQATRQPPARPEPKPAPQVDRQPAAKPDPPRVTTRQSGS